MHTWPLPELSTKKENESYTPIISHPDKQCKGQNDKQHRIPRTSNQLDSIIQKRLRPNDILFAGTRIHSV